MRKARMVPRSFSRIPRLIGRDGIYKCWDQAGCVFILWVRIDPSAIKDHGTVSYKSLAWSIVNPSRRPFHIFADLAAWVHVYRVGRIL
jgi:hypothetical protein